MLNGEVVSRPPYRTMYWSPAQMLAHLTVNGASHAHRRPVRLRHHQRPRARDQRGSFLELSWGGQGAVRPSGRTFLEDGDEVVLRYTAPGTGGGRIALGEVDRPDRAGPGRRDAPVATRRTTWLVVVAVLGCLLLPLGVLLVWSGVGDDDGGRTVAGILLGLAGLVCLRILWWVRRIGG